MKEKSVDKEGLHPEGVVEKIYRELENDFKKFQGHGKFSLDYNKVEEVPC